MKETNPRKPSEDVSFWHSWSGFVEANGRNGDIAGSNIHILSRKYIFHGLFCYASLPECKEQEKRSDIRCGEWTCQWIWWFPMKRHITPFKQPPPCHQQLRRRTFEKNIWHSYLPNRLRLGCRSTNWTLNVQMQNRTVWSSSRWYIAKNTRHPPRKGKKETATHPNSRKFTKDQGT